MSGFSPDWLALREAADHRARDRALALKVAHLLKATPEPTIVDLGCGAGSNLRALAPLLGPSQNWTLVDYDQRLLDAARARLEDWADRTQQTSGGLVLERIGQRITVRFRLADLKRDLDFALGDAPDLVTAAALFDLCSLEFIDQLAAAVAARGSVFYTALTFNGQQSWSPAHDADMAMLAAFVAHQQTDKGFGAAAGPTAPAALATAFSARGWRVEDADSPWRLNGGADSRDSQHDARLMAELATGFADAVAETELVDTSTIADWRAITRTGGVVGHTDTLALP